MKVRALWATGDLQAVELLLANPGISPFDRGAQALFQRRYAAAIEIFSSEVAAKAKRGESSDYETLNVALSQRRAGDVVAARATYEKAAQDIRRELEKVAPGSPAEASLHGGWGWAYAGLGDAASAIAQGQKAMAIDSSSKDPWEGPGQEESMANIYALLGDADHAIPILQRLLQIPYGFAITPALLRLDPVWDQIRGDPRFQESAAEGLPGWFFLVGKEPFSRFVNPSLFFRKYKSKPEDLKTVGRELGVATVLEGSVQKAAGKVRVNVQLLDARIDTHLWAKSYDRDLKDVFAVESEVAQEIADALQAKLSPSQSSALAAAPTHDTEAYDLFLKGEYQERQAESAYNGELFDRAETFYRQALAQDPNFALAYARLAHSRLYRHWYVNRLTSAQLEELKSNIEHALAIAPASADAHLALGIFYYWVHRDYDSALRELDRAIELQPNNSG